MNKRVEGEIFGLVQGVFYRESAKKKALELHITGQILNAPHGTVKVIAEGEESNLKSFIDYLKKGPTLAKVEKVNVKYKKYSGEFKSFEVLRDNNFIKDQINSYKNFARKLL